MGRSVRKTSERVQTYRILACDSLIICVKFDRVKIYNYIYNVILYAVYCVSLTIDVDNVARIRENPRVSPHRDGAVWESTANNRNLRIAGYFKLHFTIFVRNADAIEIYHF